MAGRNVQSTYVMFMTLSDKEEAQRSIGVGSKTYSYIGCYKVPTFDVIRYLPTFDASGLTEVFQHLME